METIASNWAAALAFLVVSTLVGVAVLGVAGALRVRPKGPESELKRRTYECGEAPSGMAWMQFHARYYVVALFFVVFDVEAVFLLPWAVAQRALGREGFFAVLAFVAVLMLGWLYALRKEALRWQ